MIVNLNSGSKFPPSVVSFKVSQRAASGAGDPWDCRIPPLLIYAIRRPVTVIPPVTSPINRRMASLWCILLFIAPRNKCLCWGFPRSVACRMDSLNWTDDDGETTRPPSSALHLSTRVQPSTSPCLILPAIIILCTIIIWICPRSGHTVCRHVNNYAWTNLRPDPSHSPLLSFLGRGHLGRAIVVKIAAKMVQFHFHVKFNLLSTATLASPLSLPPHSSPSRLRRSITIIITTPQ